MIMKMETGATPAHVLDRKRSPTFDCMDTAEMYRFPTKIVSFGDK